MYDDLLGPRPKEKKIKNKINLVDDNAKPADPEKHPSHESARNHGSVSSCSDSGVQSGCQGDCGDCDDECSAPTPKDPWKDVTPGPDPARNQAADDDDDGLFDLGWDEDDCDGHCENCDDELCKGVDDMLGDFFEDDDPDAEDTWLK